MARKEHDAYDTPNECALACAQWCEANLNPGGSDASRTLNVLDPTAGGGPFVRAAHATWPEARIVAVDIREEVRAPLTEAGASNVIIRDFLTIPPAAFAKVDLVLTNPPFILADALLRHLWPGLKEGASVAFLLPVTFLGSDDRWDNAGLFAHCPLRYLAPIVPRPSFMTIEGKPTSPKFEAAILAWTKGAGAVDAKIPARSAGRSRGRRGRRRHDAAGGSDRGAVPRRRDRDEPRDRL